MARHFMTCAALLVAAVNADMYLQNMRGSNNRLDEARRDRNNANRLFDSQNNNRGGYNVGSLYYYVGESMPLEWTNQHACGNEWNHCEIVIQYMCNDNVRDGVTTATIPVQPSNCLNNDCNTDVRFGMHEDYDYYTNCRYRFRNKGLFTSDRNLNGQTAIYTRQNNNGARRGYECPEERDHYPYWHPTPWIDLAILTNNVSKCDYYRAESENVLGRHFCSLPDSWYHHMVSQGGNGRSGFIPNTEALCLALNNEDTPMVTFLKAEISAEHEALQAAARAEFLACETAFADCGSTNNPATCVAALPIITEDELDETCPPCPDGERLHPDDPCGSCIPASCYDSLQAINFTAYPESGCPDGFQRDEFNTLKCIRTLGCDIDQTSYATRAQTDACRTEALDGVHLVSDGVCVQRDVLAVECLEQSLPTASWTQAQSHAQAFPDVGITAPRCLANPWSRVNHLGNGMGGFTNGFNFTMPDNVNERCAMRVRYNITTGDYNGADPHNSSEVNSSLNKNNGNNPSKVNIRASYNIDLVDSEVPYENQRGYYLEQNPQVQIFDYYKFLQFCPSADLAVPNDPTRCYTSTAQTATQQAQGVYCPYPYHTLSPQHGAAGDIECRDPDTLARTNPSNNDDDFELQLAINTAQFGRTFQDRSHRFAIRPRDNELTEKCNLIHSLNVRGKRGNIVQTFPGTEYDFTPNRLHAANGDCIHFQWTGSNTNPNNNDGQGRQGTDRSNIALQEYVRGDGGRGVEGYGGFGLNGATWTTKRMEPGLEGYVWNGAPTMGDVQCPSTYPFSHPSSTTMCFKYGTGTGDVCHSMPRGSTVSEDGEVTLNECPVLYSTDPVDETRCMVTSCVNGGSNTMIARVTNWRLFEASANPTNLASLLTTIGMSDVRLDLPSVSSMEQIGTPEGELRGLWGTSHPEHLDNVTAWGFMGMTYDQLVNLATLQNVQLGGEMSELDDAGTYYNMEPHKINGAGTYNYMCTRNNNFSNRSQKGRIIVSDGPVATEPIDEQGGAITLSLSERYQGAASTQQKEIGMADVWLQAPAGSLESRTEVSMRVWASVGTVGLDNGASDVVELGPSNLAAMRRFSGVFLTPTDGATRRRAAVSGEFWVDFAIINATAVQVDITNDGLAYWRLVKEFSGENPSVTVAFSTADDGELGRLTTRVNGNNAISAVWTSISSADMLKVEAGEVWVTLVIDGVTYSGLPEVDESTGLPMTVRVPVSPSLSYGKVYFWPASEPAARACVVNGSSSTSCNLLRQEIDASISDGEALFTVGASQTQPAGGFYQVSQGSNLALIVGVTISCFIVAVAIVGGAVYFRKHPDQWSGFKAWGPRKYKALRRSLASSV